MRGRRPVRDLFPRGRPISIHAPMRGRLRRVLCCRFPGSISIHAPMRGRHGLGKELHHLGRDFNPRPHAGATRDEANPAAPGQISIHAPMRGRLSDKAVRFHLTSPSFFREGQFSDFLSPVIRCFFFLFASPSRLQHHGGFGVVSPFGSQVLDFVLIRIAQVVEPQAVVVFVDEGF